MLDIVMISYDEPLADSLFAKLQTVAPHAKRVQGVKGIQNAHIAAARIVRTPMFYVVDGDCDVIESFDFSFVPESWDQQYTHVWYSKNPLNGLEYGYGGVKCFNTSKVLAKEDQSTLDFCSSVGDMKVISAISCITRFNQTPFMTFRATLREIVKLHDHVERHPTDIEAKERLTRWKLPPLLVEYWHVYWSAVKVAEELIAQRIDPKKVNDYDWIRSLWNEM